jgi:hypothetical protein
MIAVGMSCLATGILAQRFIHPPTDFWQGFVAGFSGALIGPAVLHGFLGKTCLNGATIMDS